MASKNWITFVLATSFIGLTGCADNNKQTSNNQLNVKQVQNYTAKRMNVPNSSHGTLRVSNRAIDNVEDISEVNQAFVIVRNNDAYVAIRLNSNQDSFGGTKKRVNTQNSDKRNWSKPGTAIRSNTKSIETSERNTGANNNKNENNSKTGASDDIAGNTQNELNSNNRNVVNPDSKKATGFKEVSNPLEQRIADQVRAADKSIQKVYVSYDADFFDKMTTYANHIKTGRNQNDIWDDFTDAISGVFR